MTIGNYSFLSFPTFDIILLGIKMVIKTCDKHFWEESEIEVGNPINCKVVVNHTVELTEEEKEQARQDAINKLRDEEMAKMRRPKTTEKKTTENNPQVAQPSLFDL